MQLDTLTEASKKAILALRDPQHFQWTMVTIFALVAFLYYQEMGRRDWHLVLACAAAWLLEFFGEVLNALILRFSGYSALWTIAGKSSYLVFVGLNIEISMMFAVAYVAFLKILPEDPARRICGLPNRWFFVIVNSLICVVVEVLLNRWGVLVWDYTYWSWPHIWSIFLCAYAPSVIFLYIVHDRASIRQKLTIIACLAALDVASVVLFICHLGWI